MSGDFKMSAPAYISPFRKRKSVERRKEQLILTSLVDIALALVIGFIVALPFFFESGIFVSAPGVAKAQVGQVSDVKVNIFLTNDGKILLNEKPVTRNNLKELLPKLLSRSVEKKVVISADLLVKYDAVVQVLDLAKQAGALELCLLRVKR